MAFARAIRQAEQSPPGRQEHQWRHDARVPARRAGRVATLCAVLVIGLAGCSSSSESATSDEAAVSGSPAAGASDTEAAGPATAGTVEQSLATRRTVSRGEIVVTVDDLVDASSQVRGIADARGGYTSRESIGISDSAQVDRYSTGDGGTTGSTSYDDAAGVPDLLARPGEARIVIRVAPQETSAAMDDIAGLGEETSRWRSDTDVELTLVDLESRIATQTQSVEELRRIMSNATDIGDIIALESEVSSRTATLESLKAQQASLADQVAYSTVTAVLRTPERTETAATEVGFVGGLMAGWAALTASVRVLLTITGAVLPFAIVLLVLGWLARRVVVPWVAPRLERRRMERQRRQPAAVGPWTSPGYPGDPRPGSHPGSMPQGTPHRAPGGLGSGQPAGGVGAGDDDAGSAGGGRESGPGGRSGSAGGDSAGKDSAGRDSAGGGDL
ncbi:MAG: DUF4349 domain-containing protein [Actinomycetales bacterium]